MSRRTSRGLVLVLAAVAIATFVATAVASVGGAQRASAPASASQYEKKVTICHRTGSKKNPFRTIRVSRNAVKAHLKHGDAVGPCATAVFTMCKKTGHGQRATVKVKGSKKASRLMRKGAKLGKCKAKGKDKGKEKDKGKDKEKPEGKKPPKPKKK